MRRLLLITTSILLPAFAGGRIDAAMLRGPAFNIAAGTAKADIGDDAVPPAGSGIVLAGGSASYNPAGQDLGPGTFLSTGSAAARTLASRGADVFNPRDFGATGNGSSVTIGTTFGSTVTASLAAFAAQSIGGATPFSWMTRPQFGLQFSMATSTDQGGAGTVLTFLENMTGINGWAASVALWQDPAHGNYLVVPGMLVTDRAGAIPSGTTVTSVNRTPGPGYGTITLSRASTADVPLGDTITFTIAPAQLQTLTVDWLGIQSAMAAAWQAAAGGTVYIPAGDWMLNHSLVNAGGITDTGVNVPALTLRGDGMTTTRLTWAADLGQDACAILSAGRGTGTTSQSAYRDMRLIGPRVALVLGRFPNGMDGLCTGAKDAVRDFRVDYMRSAFNVMRDHVALANTVAGNNGYGIYWAPYTPTTGGVSVKDTDLTGNQVAGIGVSTTNTIDSDRFDNVHTGLGPYGIYLEAATPNVTTQIGSFITNSMFLQMYMEALGGSFIYGAGKTGTMAYNHFIGGGNATLNFSTSKSSGQGTPPALIYVDTFSNNTMEGTNWGGTYNSVTDAVVEANGRCWTNTWINDTSFVFNSTTTVGPLRCPGGVYQDEFFTGQGDGLIQQMTSTLAAGAPVTDNGNNSSGAFTNGANFEGMTAVATTAGQSVGVLTRAGFFSGALKATASQSISPGQPVFATAGGFVGGLDQDGAVGAAAGASGSGTTTLILDLDPGMKGGSAGTTTGATATGTTQATAYVITAPSTQFSTVASGSGAILGMVPIGRSIYVANDGASSLLVYPQPGGQIGAASANAGVSVAPGTSAVFRRLSMTLWHQ